MTVFLFDTSAKLAREVDTRQPCALLINELVDADDILVVVADLSRRNTLAMWTKFEVHVGCEAYIEALDGSVVACRRSSLYFGSCLDAFGAAGPEICRRLGEADGQLDKLVTTWLAAFHTAHQTKDPFF